jgi:hypothetical protein
MLPPEAYPAGEGFLDALHVPLGPQLRLKLRHRTQHIKEQAAGGLRDSDMLVQHAQCDACRGQGHRALAQVQRRACQTVQARDPEDIARADIPETLVQRGAIVAGARGLFLEDRVTADRLKLGELDRSGLSHRTDPRIPDVCHDYSF